MEYIEIGQIVNTNGLKGVVKVNPFTDDISKFEDLKYVYIQLKNELKKVKIEQVRYNKNQVLLKLEGIDSIEEAEKYRNFYLKTEKESQEDLGEDTYYIVDLIGLDVYSDKNEYLGKIEDVFPTGSNDVYVVKDNLGKQILIPAIADVVKEVDLKNKKMTINLIPGLI
ncbi:ribosome maturation factor RimM [Clostridium sp. CAG:354]|jgi:16S rRNA processing protein RimM|uniref:ribosome maturation factor RimM n=1 Tax=Candidatus Merdicola sp. TaxID=3085652 RepID=UPI00033C3804|nr:16S rRNA processing protein RimM [Clostridium sp.]MEE0268778.1 ribosome maturation factor RimM [Clostridia bacterium]CDE10366.1 ribosome maturation factor RimM [Clostridium sp. CAG:354]